MEFKSHRLSDGLFAEPSMLYERPLRPGTFLVKVPVVADMQCRTGLVVGLTADPFLVGLGAGAEGTMVHVAWNDWRPQAGIARGELWTTLGIRAQSKRERREQKRKRKQERDGLG